MKRRDDNVSALCKPAAGEAGRTGDWRDVRPVIDNAKCTAVKRGEILSLVRR
jgi:Pyruvate/2-oxoacid:ferredoxin oxidoreductase delta subunit